MSLTFKDARSWGFISNQNTASLIDGRGNVLWLCFPRFDSDPVVAFLLDEENGGKFYIRPADPYESEQEYLAPNVLKTTFKSAGGNCSIVDALLPGKNILVRDIRSEVDLELEIKPTFNFNNSQVNRSERDGFSIFDNASGSERLAVKIGMEIKSRDNGGKYILKPGEGQVALAYYPSQEMFDFPAEREAFKNLSKSIQTAIEFWNSKSRIDIDGLRPAGDQKLDQAFKTSVWLILGLMYAPSGGIVASPTTSLPEEPGGPRNWDYRYVWTRDCSIMASALCDAGLIVEGRRALGFLFGLLDLSGKPFSNLYKVNGSKIYGERYLMNFSGFMNSKPVKAGNRASNQIQLDVEGEFLDALYHYFNRTKDTEFISSHSKAIEYICDWISENWQLADSSIWEKPEDKDYTYSKVMMWVALDRAGKLMAAINHPDKWSKTRDLIRGWVMSNCVKDGHFVTEAGGTTTDATPLLFPLYGFIDPKDRIFLNTLSLIEKTLVNENFVFRYTSDSLGRSTHPFTLCSFWLSSVYSMLGMEGKARAVLRNVVNISGPLCLFGEDIDIDGRTFTGNFPQGFAHAGFISAYLNLLRLASKQ
ncbi:MAG: glycoside hydrolase family 15 protein [Candidatus Parvarchaeota archaeon]|nr:glycoside hydrolase family 15 protein [Candidatus Parvarchaeota archaeon]